VAGNKLDMERDNRSENDETQQERNISAALNVPGLIRTLQRSKKNIDNALMMVNIMETRIDKTIKIK
jgi:hypothetical protein